LPVLTVSTLMHMHTPRRNLRKNEQSACLHPQRSATDTCDGIVTQVAVETPAECSLTS